MPTRPLSPGARFRAALKAERPLQVVGTVKSLRDVCEDVRRITQVTGLPLLVDADTGWGGPSMVARTVREMTLAGAAGCHIEDQVHAKLCGHLPGKQLVSAARMSDRIRSAARARTDPSFVIMARTDSHAIEGLEGSIDRAKAYVAAGADMIFAEALTTLAEYRAFTAALGRVPVLANITEFGKTPLFTLAELRSAGLALALYPLGAFRAMSRSAEEVYATIRRHGTQKAMVPAMQTRAELYEVLHYEEHKARLGREAARRPGRKGV
jgi:methylisocitrate lyase